MIFRSPILLHYFITNRCNCSCSFCNIWKQKPTPFADLSDVKRNLFDAKKLGAKFVDFTGGEPLLHPDLSDMLAKAKELGYRTSVTTNCILYPQKAKVLQGKIDYLHFSLDALDEFLHNSARGQNSYGKVLESLDIAKSLGERPDILFTVTNTNFFQLEKMAQFAKKLRLLLIVNPQFNYFNNTKLLNKVWESIAAIARNPFVYVNNALNRLHKSGGNDIQNPRCRVVDSCFVISPQNELLLPCYHFAQTRGSIGRSLYKVRNSPAFIEARINQGRMDFCKGCSINCYFDPSFLYKFDFYLFASLIAKLKYFINKEIVHIFSPFLNNQLSAFEIAQQVLNEDSMKETSGPTTIVLEKLKL